MATPLPLSPFITAPNHRFVLNETRFMRDITGTEEMPVFLSDPSESFIAGFHRDVLPMLEDAVRRSA